MEINIIFQDKGAEPQLADIQQPLFDMSTSPRMTVCLIEGGMSSGEPSVILVSSDETGSAIMQTSLDKFLTAGSAMAEAAKTRWGWARPEGTATLFPSSNVNARRALLKSLIKELKEWDELEENG